MHAMVTASLPSTRLTHRRRKETWREEGIRPSNGAEPCVEGLQIRGEIGGVLHQGAGFVLIERPESFDFDGAWLFNYGVGIHLVQCKDEEKLPRDKDCLDPMDNHISFQCESMEEMEEKLKDMDVKYMKRTVGEEEGAAIDQLFFNDPDGFMVEICNCENLKLVPQRSIGKIKLPSDKHNPPLDLGDLQGDDDAANAGGFYAEYYNWTSHGEERVQEYFEAVTAPPLQDKHTTAAPVDEGTSTQLGDATQINWAQRMDLDAAGAAFCSSTYSQDGAPDDGTRSCPLDGGPSSYYYGGGPYDYVSGLADRFHDVLHAAEQPLWNGCTTSQLAAVVELVDIKADGNISQ
ncbi:UNVERIFIED_CONTAM: hypothetical protein Slati_0954100 [Sesamum latifolium]|uniref:VOC domain-containing protein n=1 Tax=Sesamum latifolium TaxID=2727402 RepID=A0AAW2XSP0_9LAMI